MTSYVSASQAYERERTPTKDTYSNTSSSGWSGRYRGVCIALDFGVFKIIPPTINNILMYCHVLLPQLVTDTSHNIAGYC